MSNEENTKDMQSDSLKVEEDKRRGDIYLMGAYVGSVYILADGLYQHYPSSQIDSQPRSLKEVTVSLISKRVDAAEKELALMKDLSKEIG